MTLATEFDSIQPDGAGRTNAGTVTFTVTFTAPVQNLAASNFSLGGTGTLAGTAIQSVMETTPGDASTYTVTVSTGTGDGELQLAFDPTGVLDSNGHPLAVSTGVPEFQASVDLTVGGGPRSITMADIDGEGSLDLVITYEVNEAAVLLNDGNGNFAPAAHYGNADDVGVTAPAIGDLNGDGKADIVMVGNGGIAAVLLNNGDGTFASPVNYTLPGPTFGVAMSDVNGDGETDIVAAGYYGALTVLQNNGDGTFAVQPSTTGPISSLRMAMTDLNGDGKGDIVSVDNTHTASVLLNDGSGNFAASVDYPTGSDPFQLAVGDLNGDGATDVVTANQFSGITVLLNNGHGSFTPVNYSFPQHLLGVAVADMDGDGDNDVIVSDVDHTTVSVFLNDGLGNLATPIDYATTERPYGLAVGDLDGDGKADIATTNFGVNTVSVLLQQSGGEASVTLDRTDATGSASLSGSPAANATTVDFNLTFSEDVTGLDAADFALVPTGTAAGTITGFTGSGGSYTLTVSGITGTGSLAIELASGATVTDLAGNAVTLAPVTPHTLDTDPPAAPTLRTPHALTTETRPIFAGLAEAGSTVKLYDTDGTTLLGSTVADANGNWVVRRTAVTLIDGEHVVTATATDAAGNVSAVAPPVSVKVDTLAPNAPLITSSAVTGTASPVLAGTAEALSTVKVYDGATLLGTATANAIGVWSLPLSSPLSEGGHSISAVAQDAVGHSSPASLVQSLVVDLTAPAAPALDTLPALGNTVITTLTGTAEPDAVVEVFDGTTSLGSIAANGSGVWTLPLTTPLSDGSYNLSATATDAAGNASAASAAVAVAVDTLAPSAPSLVAPALTNDSTPSLTGTAEAGSTVEVFDGIASLGSVTADEHGTWTLELASPLLDGPHSLTAVATDAAGNPSPASTPVALSVDSVAPAVPTIDIVPQANADSTPVFFGTAEALSYVDVYDGETLVQRTQADANGDWWLIAPAALADGEHQVTAKAVDAAGNSSDSSQALPVLINAEPPAAPVISAGTSPTNAQIDTLTGTAEAGSMVEVFDGASSLGTTAADGSGNWSLALGTALAEGPHALTAVATDGDGFISDPSAPLTIEVDQTAPAAPMVDALPALANLPVSIVSGTADLGSTVEVFDGATSLGSVAADGLGGWSLTLGTPLGDGEHSLTAVATDAAGNTSSASGEVDFTLDLTAPQAPAFGSFAALTNDTTPTLVGTAEAGSSVEVFDGSVSLGVVAADSHGAWTLTPGTALAEGRHSFTATALDAAGNLSARSAVAVVKVDTIADAGAQATLVASTSLVEPAAAKAVSYIVQGLDADAHAVATFTDGVDSVQAMVAVNGRITVDLSSLVNGKVSSSLAITDAAGNTAEATGDKVAFVRADENPFVDDLYYLLHNPDVVALGMDPDEHYANFGWKEGRDPSAVFSTVAYLSANRDVAEAGINPLEHFLQHGEREGRDPSVSFDVQAYLDHNPDVVASGMGALEHYLLFGRDEGRATYAEASPHMVSGFDASYYLAANPDIAASGMDPLQHFLQFGLFEGRQPSDDLLG